jgi:hypothetical protein
LVVLGAVLKQLTIEIIEAFGSWDGNQVLAPKSTNSTLDAALLWSPFDPHAAELRLEKIMRTESDKTVRLDSSPPSKYLGHNRAQIVISNQCEDSAKILEASHMCLEKRPLARSRKRNVKLAAAEAGAHL